MFASTRLLRAIPAGIVLTALAVCAQAPPASPAGAPAGGHQFRIGILSSRPDMITGGSALVEISVPPQFALKGVTVQLNGQNITSVFRQEPGVNKLLAVVPGFNVGVNTMALLNEGKVQVQAELKNFPITGPVFSGPQEEPFQCQTQQFILPDGSSLGAPLDASCSVKTAVHYVYKSTEPLPAGSRNGALNIKPLTDLKKLPADVATTTTTAGKTVPYVVRVETGTVNRSIYQFAVLSDPTKESAPDPLAAPAAWNGRLIFGFGGGCVNGWYRQGSNLGADSGSRGQGPGEGGGATPGSAVISDDIVGKGYAEAGSSLNVAGNNCNDTLSAETMMMVKERFIKAYGKPAFTFGRGGSGGSYQQNQIADRYPGLLDGIIPSLTFPDVQELVTMIADSRLLNNYFKHDGAGLSAAKKLAVSGVAENDNIISADPLAGRINPTEYCPTSIPKEQRYDAKTNPKGVRCDVYDHNINIYGRDPATGYARRPVDNVGVQYGLAALNSGAITPAEFLDLNEKIGGYDSDGYLSAHRAVADPAGLRAAYQNDLITYGSHLAQMPIIDVRPYRDKLPNGDNHLKYHSFSLRARLEQVSGSSANDVLIVGPAAQSKKMEAYAITKMDEWLTAMANDHSQDAPNRKTVKAKPADLVDACWTATGERIVEPQTFSGGKCNELYPTAPSPRMVAGQTILANNTLKCELKPISAADYRVALTDDQLARLKSIFPQGVCDWSRPGVEQQPPTAGPWHAY